MQKYLRARHGGVNERQMSASIKVAVGLVQSLVVFKMSDHAVSHRNRPFWPFYVALLLFTLILTSTLQRVSANPLLDFTRRYENLTSESSTENSMGNSTENLTDNSANSTTDDSNGSTDNSTEIAPNTDVYVIKAVVYEIGILTDTDNTTSSESAERQERVDISLYGTPQEDEFS